MKMIVNCDNKTDEDYNDEELYIISVCCRNIDFRGLGVIYYTQVLFKVYSPNSSAKVCRLKALIMTMPMPRTTAMMMMTMTALTLTAMMMMMTMITMAMMTMTMTMTMKWG